MSSVALERARGGDEAAFAALIGPHRRELHLHCYRMLGSVADAEDVLQETLSAAWRGLDGFTGRSSLRTWLYRIATNRCLNAIRDTKRRPPPTPVPPFEPPTPSRHGDVTWLQPYPDAWLDQLPDRSAGPEERYQRRETIELAFIAALQRLPPRQTAALVLCDVVGFSVAEAAGVLSAPPTAVKGLLQRARATLDCHRSALGQPAPIPGSGDERELARRFAEAMIADDLDAVVGLLSDDAWLAMPPAPHEYHGPVAIAAFLRASTAARLPRRLRLVATRANTQPAFAYYHAGPGDLAERTAGVIVLALSGKRITTATRFLDPRVSVAFMAPHGTPRP